MKVREMQRWLQPLKQRIFLLVGRALLAAINNTGMTQRLQITGLYGETITDIERFQNYGFEGYPWEQAEAACIFPNGNRDAGLVVVVHDRRYRPTDLVQGEICLYTDEDKTTPFRIQLKRSRILFARGDIFDFDVDTDMTEDIGGDKDQTIGGSKTEGITTQKQVTVPTEQHNNTTTFIVVSPQIQLGSATWGDLRKLIDSRFQDLFNNHDHDGIEPGSGTTATASASGHTLGDGHMTDKARAV